MAIGFTLQEEAVNTERHHSFWSSDQRLRHSKINFVSAGPSNPVEVTPEDAESEEVIQDPEPAMAEMTLDSPPAKEMFIEVEVEDEDEEGEEDEAERKHEEYRPAIAEPEQNDLFFVDTVGDALPSTGLPTPATRIRASSPTPSNSSEEIILFQGRNRQNDTAAKPSKAPRVVADPIDAGIKANRVYEREATEAPTSSEAVSSRFFRQSASSSPSKFEAILPKSQSKRRGRGRSGIDQEEEDALIADYIANTQGGEDAQGWSTSARFQQRPLGGSGDGVEQDGTESPADQPNRSKSPLRGGWDRSYICDFDDLSTSDGVMGELQVILSKRIRSSGVQYLIVWEGQSIDEARWVPATTLTTAEALLHVADFEEEEKLVAEYQGNDDEDSTDSDDMDTDDALDEEDDEDLWEKKADHLTDEQIARLLAKQEELGMGADELLLLDDAADADADDDLPRPSTRYNPFVLAPQKSKAQGRGAKHPRGDFPAATAMADAYDGFDIMDFERPSLKKKPKGRRGKLPFDLSDSELEASLQAAYENDRAKKKERKQQREALRAEGLLGSKNGKPNLKDKYREGMGIGAVKNEIKAFLISNNTT
jgi:hypothetical protein